ncbi:DUF3806 domain-containing protein [Myxococcota bacterium]|nr:DUF3806 domain-containing protein [Myxococcota bacterium]
MGLREGLRTMAGWGARGAIGWALVVSGLVAVSSPLLASDPDTLEAPELEALSAVDEASLQDQRSLVASLARRYVGTPLSQGSTEDLRVLQRLVDRLPDRDRRLRDLAESSFADRDRIYELQSFGVVLGDVMVRNLGLEWVIVQDEYGRSRALRLPDTRYLFFPITMLSKRYEKGLRPNVQALYDKVARNVTAARLQKR